MRAARIPEVNYRSNPAPRTHAAISVLWYTSSRMCGQRGKAGNTMVRSSRTRWPKRAVNDEPHRMVRAATTLVLLLLAAEVRSETVDVKYRGNVDLKTFDCRDINRGSFISAFVTIKRR